MQTGMMRLRELTVRYEVRKDHEGQPIVVGRNLGSPRETASALMTALQDQPGEVFAILCVSTKLRVIAYHEVSRGTLDATLVHPREVLAIVDHVHRTSKPPTVAAELRAAVGVSPRYPEPARSSQRSGTIGSTLVIRRAGIQQPNVADVSGIRFSSERRRLFLALERRASLRP
jgi:hypothetical protein